ncbi:MAG: hypothetical protein NZ519_11015, partial [Bacteroidia bacterium]|nr:hypothetical protein [Bacteroidia bacterium]
LFGVGSPLGGRPPNTLGPRFPPPTPTLPKRAQRALGKGTPKKLKLLNLYLKQNRVNFYFIVFLSF